MVVSRGVQLFNPIVFPCNDPWLEAQRGATSLAKKMFRLVHRTPSNVLVPDVLKIKKSSSSMGEDGPILRSPGQHLKLEFSQVDYGLYV